MAKKKATAKRRAEGERAPSLMEQVDIAELRPHPRNYKTHPEAQLAHLRESLKQYGVYRNVVVARDGTILAGHGVVEAATGMGLSRITVRRLDLDPMSPAALKLLALDNELPKFAEVDERALAEILQKVMDTEGLLGTGYGEEQLMKMLARVQPVDLPKDDAAAKAERIQAGDVPSGLASHVSMVQIYMNKAEREEFDDAVKVLSGVYGTKNRDTTVLEALRRARTAA